MPVWVKNVFLCAVVAGGLWALATKGLSGQTMDRKIPVVIILGFLSFIGIFTSVALLNTVWMLAIARRVPLIYLGHRSADTAVFWAAQAGGSGKSCEVIVDGFNTLQSVGKTIEVLKDPATGELMDARDVRIDHLLKKLGLWALTFTMTTIPALALIFGGGLPGLNHLFFEKLHLTPTSAILLFSLAVILTFFATPITDLLRLTPNEHRRWVSQRVGSPLNPYASLGTEFRSLPEVEKRSDFAAAPQTWKPKKILREGAVLPATLLGVREWGATKNRAHSRFRFATFRLDDLFPQPVFASEFFYAGDAEDKKLSAYSPNSSVSVQLGPDGSLRLAS